MCCVLIGIEVPYCDYKVGSYLLNKKKKILDKIFFSTLLSSPPEPLIFCLLGLSVRVLNVGERAPLLSPKNVWIGTSISSYYVSIVSANYVLAFSAICFYCYRLDPDNDPLCVTLLLDYYAIRAEQYQYLVRLYREWDAERNLCQLPNFAFSVPLALFHMARAGAGEDTMSSDELEADKMVCLPYCLCRKPSIMLSHDTKAGLMAYLLLLCCLLKAFPFL